MEIVTVNGGCEADRRRLRRLRCSVKDYDWGRIGSDSLVYRVYAANSDYQIDSTRPYAELWMGTHESGPSYLEDANGSNGVTLRSWISENPESVGNQVLEKWGCDLPFLFKVLSVARPLSIQAHPDKNLAKKMHKAHPNLYKEFEVDLCDLPSGASTVFPSVPGPSILLVLQGDGRMYTEDSADEISMGDVLFAPADTEIHLRSSSDLKLYRAGVNSRFLYPL